MAHTYKEYISKLKDKYVGRRVVFLRDGKEYTVVDVDYNGGLLINKSNEYNDTTSIPETMASLVPKKKPKRSFAGWTACADHTPTKSGYYLTCNMGLNNPVIDYLEYSKKYNAWNSSDSFDSDNAYAFVIEVTHWAPLPALPNC